MKIFTVQNFLKTLSVIIMIVILSDKIYAQTNIKTKIDPKVLQSLLTKASKKTITDKNIKDYPAISKNAVAVNYSSSLYYLVRLKSDSSIYTR